MPVTGRNEEDHQSYQEKANEIAINKNLNSTEYIENTRSQMKVLILDISKIVSIFYMIVPIF